MYDQPCYQLFEASCCVTKGTATRGLARSVSTWCLDTQQAMFDLWEKNHSLKFNGTIVGNYTNIVKLVYIHWSVLRNIFGVYENIPRSVYDLNIYQYQVLTTGCIVRFIDWFCVVGDLNLGLEILVEKGRLFIKNLL